MCQTSRFQTCSLLVILVLSGASSSPGRPLLVGYWGQNSAGPANGPANNERPLKDVCETTKYDVLAVAFVDSFWDVNNEDQLPSLNLNEHCSTPVSSQYPKLLRCPSIQEGIKECQRRGKKVLISIGGPTGDGTLPTPAKAKELAHTLFNLFLGGSDYSANIRPFGDAKMDGVDLFIEGGRKDHYPEFIRELRKLMDKDTQKHYLITSAPDCLYPDAFLGPKTEGSGLEEAGQYVDHLYIKFYNNRCHTGDIKSFQKELDSWLSFSQRKGPLIFIGVPAHPKASNAAEAYRSPSELSKIFKKVKDKAGVGGIMIWDVSWDQNNMVNGKRYSEHVYDFLQEETKTAAPASASTPQITLPTQGSFSCADKADGFYPDPSDCSKYHQCTVGVQYDFGCPPGLLFDKALKTCQWPTNVQC